MKRAGTLLRGGFLLCCWLKPVQEVHGTLCVGGGGEDCPLVLLEDFEPAFDVGRMILADLEGQCEIGGEERRAEFGNQLFLGVGFIAPALAPEVSVKP